MTPSAELYAESSMATRQAEAMPHEKEAIGERFVCARSCRRCRLDARARLFLRCGDSRRVLEERP